MRRICGTLLVLALAALAAACGSYTKKDFVARANGICINAVAKTRNIPPPAFSGSKTEQLTSLSQYLGRVLPIVQAEESDLRNLKRPPGTAQDLRVLDSYYAALGQAVDSYRDLQAAAARGDTQGVATAEGALRTNRAATLAARYGIRSCGVPGGTGVSKPG